MDKHEQFISEEDRELQRIRQRKLQELMERKLEMNIEPAHVTDSNFNEIIKACPLALIDFWAAWCAPCRALEPTIEELASEYSGKVFIGKLNVDENPEIAELFQVFSIPTLVVMKGGKEVDRIVGCVPKGHIQKALEKYMES